MHDGFIVNWTEDQIRTIIRIAREALGESAAFEQVHDLVRRSVAVLEREGSIGSAANAPGSALILCISTDAERNRVALSEGLQGLGCRETERCEHRLDVFQVTLASIRLGTEGADWALFRRRLAEAGNQRGVRVILLTEDLLTR